MRAPTDARFLNDAEWAILGDVFGTKLPLRYRILVTDALGGGNRPFTIPTSAISALTIPSAIEAAFKGFVAAKLGRLGGALGTISNVTGFLGHASLPSQIAGTVNLGYLVNVGASAYRDMSGPTHRNLLVHELAHVWQGANSRSSMTYVNNSILHQCRADFSTGASHHAAYAYTPGRLWQSYNAEQQASIVEDWFKAGKPESGDLWPYVRDYVRKGIV